MKILKVSKTGPDADYYMLLVDQQPSITYEYEEGTKNLIGSAVDEDGDVILSHYLTYNRQTAGFKAFAGREFTITMKDGSNKTLKDYWWDSGSYPGHGKFISVGLLSEEPYKQSACYVYYGRNICKAKLEKLLDEYFLTDVVYEYYDIKHWLDTKDTIWYRVWSGDTKLPLLVDKDGRFVDLETHEFQYCARHIRISKGISKIHRVFYYEHIDPVTKKLTKHERSIKEIITTAKSKDTRELRDGVTNRVYKIFCSNYDKLKGIQTMEASFKKQKLAAAIEKIEIMNFTFYEVFQELKTDLSTYNCDGKLYQITQDMISVILDCMEEAQ